jgi:hypothetical protein
VDFFDFVFTRYLAITKIHKKNHGAAPGHLFNRESMNFFDFVFSTSFGHHQTSHENHGAAPGHHFKIRHLA